MGARELPTAALTGILLGWALLGSAMPAQGPVYRERWGFLHLDNRRYELLQELRGRDAATTALVAELLVEPDKGIPFTPVARAMSLLRGVHADDAFLLRSMLATYVLPEVADPEGRNEACRRNNVSLFLPFAVELPEELALDLEVRDAAGERVWSARVGESPSLEDLRMARLVAAVPAAELPDGSYLVELRASIGGEPPGAKDPTLTWRLHVLRGFQERCERAFADLQERAGALSTAARALLLGCAMPVQRAYAGEAFDAESDAVNDLLRLEQALQNVAAERHVLAGMTGDVSVQLPAAESRGLAAVLRLPADFDPERARARPLVVFAPAAPAYDVTVRRPTSPASRGPRWAARELRTFGSDLDCDIAFLESPGEVSDYVGALSTALASLRQVFGTGDAPLLLVCEGEAATITAFHLARLQSQLQGLVLVGAGAMTGKVLDGLGRLPVRMQPVPGCPGSQGLVSSLDYVTARTAAGEWHGDVARLCDRQVPWSLAVPLLAGDIESFATRVFARPAAPK